LGINNLSEKETIDQVKDKQGIFSKIQNFFTLGYGTKEDLRELDSKLRDLYYIELRDMRHVWEDLYLEAMDAGECARADRPYPWPQAGGPARPEHQGARRDRMRLCITRWRAQATGRAHPTSEAILTEQP